MSSLQVMKKNSMTSLTEHPFTKVMKILSSFFFTYNIKMKKMGRPSRKVTATMLSFEEANGNVLYFKIDKKGKSRIIGDKQSIFPIMVFHHKELNSSYLSAPIDLKITDKLQLNQNVNIFDDQCIKKEQSNPQSPKYCIKNDNFNLFLEKIEKRVDSDDLLKNFKLSNNMFPSYA